MQLTSPVQMTSSKERKKETPLNQNQKLILSNPTLQWGENFLTRPNAVAGLSAVVMRSGTPCFPRLWGSRAIALFPSALRNVLHVAGKRSDSDDEPQASGIRTATSRTALSHVRTVCLRMRRFASRPHIVMEIPVWKWVPFYRQRNG
jgi:hypothetical protein